MNRLTKRLALAAVAWMGVHAVTGAANDEAMGGADEATTIYSAFLTQWMGEGDSPINVATTAKAPMPDQIRQYNDCAGNGGDERIHWTTGTTDADLKRALSPIARVRLVDPDQWHPRDPHALIAEGKSVDAAVEAGVDGGLMIFSAISFNEAHDVAMLSFSFVCGSLCGHGGAVMFNKTPSGWLQSRKQCSSWIS